jgi:two-component system, cell cycle sensor histidine kinase PleC
LTAVIESLLKHAFVESGRLTTRMSTFDVQQIAREVIAELYPYAEKKRIELRAITHSEDVRILSDPELTRLVLLNLVGNAIKFMEHGIVEISTDRTAEGCRFAVRDSGPGIPADERARVFEPFARVGDITQVSVAGMGLGLSLVREIASALGGHVELESEIDHGSTFTVTLPSLPEALRDPQATLT